MQNIFNSKLFRITIFLFLVGSISLILENSLYQYVDENNILKESFFMPIAIISLFISIICFLYLIIKVSIHYYKENKSLKENIIGTNFDYSDENLSVYFEVADKKLAEDILGDVSYIKNFKKSKHGFTLNISAQQIPEIISHLLTVNIAIYAVIPKKE
jgi:hypothetical protein